MSQKPNPDGALIALCAVHTALFAVVNACTEDVESHPSWPAYCAAFDAISTATPQTYAGLLAMAECVRVEADCGEDGEPVGIPIDLSWRIISGLLRLHGGAFS